METKTIVEIINMVLWPMAALLMCSLAVWELLKLFKQRREERELHATAEELKPFSLSDADCQRVMRATVEELERLGNPLNKSWIEKQIAALSLKTRNLGAKTDADYERERLAAEVARQIKLQQETEEWRKDPPATRRIITDIKHPEARAYWEEKNPSLRGKKWEFCLIDADTHEAVPDNTGAHRALVWFAVETPREDRRPVKEFKWELVSGKFFDRDGAQRQTIHTAFKVRNEDGFLDLTRFICSVEALDFPITPEGGNNLLQREI